MTYKANLLNSGDKDLICEYVYRSTNRIMNKTLEGWDRPIPQGVSVFIAHPETGEFEYLFTKDDKYPVVRDSLTVVIPILHKNIDASEGGVIMYMNACMMTVYSKHKAHSY